MSIFDRLDRLTSKQVDRTFASRFRCEPHKTPPNGRPQPDPDRPAWIGRGVLEENSTFQQIEVGNRDRTGNDLQTLATGAVIELSVDRSSYSQARNVRQGDIIRLHDMRSFRVASVRPDGISRVVLLLTNH